LIEGAELLAAIGMAWMTGGLIPEGTARLEACIAALPSTASTLLAQLGAALCDLYLVIGRYVQAGEAADAAVRSARAAGNGPVLANALRGLARWRNLRGDFAAATALLTEAESITGLPAIIQSNLLMLRGQLSMEIGDLDVATRSFARTRDQFRSLGFLRNVAVSQSFMAEVEFRRERYHHAADLWRYAAALFRSENDPVALSGMLEGVGQALAACGDLEAARIAAIESLAVATPQGFEHVAPPIELLAYIAGVQGDVERSARLAGYAAACFTDMGYVRGYVSRAMHDRLTSLMQAHLAPDVLERLTADGAALTPEAAIALARDEPATPAA
jgi:tetratricopeptide (TPR) repeat protein